MLNNRKIRLMAKLTMFEEAGEGREAIRMSKYYKHDYVRWEMIKTIVSMTGGYILILVLVFMYQMEYLIANAVKLDYVGIGTKVLGGYLVLLVIYACSSVVGYSYKYEKGKKNLNRYSNRLKHLRRIYKEEASKQEVRSK